jgi:hypothetical protein
MVGHMSSIDRPRPATARRTAAAAENRSRHFQTTISSDDLKQIQGHRHDKMLSRT